MQPTAPSFRQTRRRFLNPRLPFVKAVSNLFLNDNYANYACRLRDNSDHCVGAGIGRMLETFQPSGVLTRVWFMRKRMGWAVWPAGAIRKVIGT
jgi:hypothetical protein